VEAPSGLQIRDTAQRGEAATKGARLCPQDQPQQAGKAQRVGVKQESCSPGWPSDAESGANGEQLQESAEARAEGLIRAGLKRKG